MDSLPRELIDIILQQCIVQCPRNDVLNLRLVCRAFDRFLKPYACQTISLEFSRLSAASGRRRPDPDALQTIGKHCKAMYIDLMVLRDEFEVDFLSTIFERVPSMKSFIHTLQRRYCLSDTSFTEVDYRHTLRDMLFNCQNMDRLRVNLPFQLVGQRCNAATMILAHTFSALNERLEQQEEGEAIPLQTLVLDNVSDQTIYNLWTNPIDVMNIIRVLLPLRNLVLSVRRHELADPQLVAMYGSCLWGLIGSAELVDTLCLVGNDDDKPPRGLKQTKAWLGSADEWRARTLPEPRESIMLPNLTCLELKRVEVTADVLRSAARNFGPALRELYLNEVYLKAEQGTAFNADTKQVLWIGVPNQRPGLHDDWIAMIFREYCAALTVCRASFLGYDQLIREDVFVNDANAPNPAPFISPEFDFVDPCGLGRSVAQRFVEVVMGYEQPPSAPPDPGPVTYLPQLASNDYLLGRLRKRPRVFRVTEYDVNAYQTAVRNPTSRWQRSIDGLFPNQNSSTLEELHYIAETACRGMNEIQRRRDEQTGHAAGDQPGQQGQEQGLRQGQIGGGGAAGGGWLAENLLNLHFVEEN